MVLCRAGHCRHNVRPCTNSLCVSLCGMTCRHFCWLARTHQRCPVKRREDLAPGVHELRFRWAPPGWLLLHLTGSVLALSYVYYSSDLFFASFVRVCSVGLRGGKHRAFCKSELCFSHWLLYEQRYCKRIEPGRLIGWWRPSCFLIDSIHIQAMLDVDSSPLLTSFWREWFLRTASTPRLKRYSIQIWIRRVEWMWMSHLSHILTLRYAILVWIIARSLRLKHRTVRHILYTYYMKTCYLISLIPFSTRYG